MRFRRKTDGTRMPNLVGASRKDDPPNRPLGWQLGVAIRKYPVQAAIFAALLVLSVPVFLLTQKGGDLERAQKDLRAAQTELKSATSAIQDVIDESQKNRKQTTLTFCEAINGNAIYANGQTDVLRAMILDGARSSRAFEDLYTSHGLPSYKVRLKMAHQAAKRLQEKKIPVLDCDEYVNEIEREDKGAPRQEGVTP